MADKLHPVALLECKWHGGRTPCLINSYMGALRSMKVTTRIGASVFLALCTLIGLIGCSPFTALNALTPATSSNVTTALAYGSDPRQKLDIYTPGDNTQKVPVVIFFYGGNWNSGERDDYAFVGRALAARGIVAVIADYRLYPEAHYPQILDDAANAVAWTAREISRYGGDVQKLFVMGHSAGAYNASMLALDKRWLAGYGMTPAALRGWIGLAGPYNFLPIQNPEIRPIFFYPNTPPTSQPIYHVSPASPPALLIAPQSDAVVDPAKNTGELSRALRANNVPVIEQYFSTVSHPTLVASLSGPLRALAPTLDIIERFVKADTRSTSTATATAPMPSVDVKR